MAYLLPKSFLLKDSSSTAQYIRGGGDKGVNTFIKVISPKVNVIAGLEFELASNAVTVQHVSHCATGTLN